MRSFFVLILSVVLLAGAGASQAAPAPAAGATSDVRVVLRLLPPFVERRPDGSLTGFSYELWNDIAGRIHASPTYVVAPDVRSQLEAVDGAKADIGVGAISITSEREARFDFSQPILNAGLQILVRSEQTRPEANALQEILALLLSPAVLVWLGIAMLLTVVPAHIIWFIERNCDDGLIKSKTYFPGIFEAFFWGLGTLATQAHSMPRHWASRIVAILWMFTSVVFVAFYTAQLTANLTVKQFKSEIDSADDLVGRPVATITGSTSAQYLQSSGAKVSTFENTADAFAALKTRAVDAVVFDAPVLQYYAAHEGADATRVVGQIFHNEDYGFAFRQDSPLRRQVNVALLKSHEDGTYDRLMEKYFGKK